jgi:dolichyl-phosphate beta-glucosyltransferase
VPCFNEAQRLDTQAFADMAAVGDVRLIFVDDGSTDDTPRVLEALVAACHGRAQTLKLVKNSGKAEAVRQGLLLAIAQGATEVGFLDADLATPPEELRRLLAILHEKPETQVLIAARVRLLGNAVERKAMRHYLGRIFATAASLTLALHIYDTQCGAKLFRVTPSLAAALAEPFVSRWIFDVELLGRLAWGGPGAPPLPQSAFSEVPLQIWHDVAGSKLRPGHFIRAAGDLAQIWLRLRARQQHGVQAFKQ